VELTGLKSCDGATLGSRVLSVGVVSASAAGARAASTATTAATSARKRQCDPATDQLI
jgi:hypothetical protein